MADDENQTDDIRGVENSKLVEEQPITFDDEIEISTGDEPSLFSLSDHFSKPERPALDSGDVDFESLPIPKGLENDERRNVGSIAPNLGLESGLDDFIQELRQLQSSIINDASEGIGEFLKDRLDKSGVFIENEELDVLSELVAKYYFNQVVPQIRKNSPLIELDEDNSSCVKFKDFGALVVDQLVVEVQGGASDVYLASLDAVMKVEEDIRPPAEEKTRHSGMSFFPRIF